MDKLTMWANSPNITTTSTTRKTVDGRRLTYRLHVLQQPERARACGNGAKASADRRPVDPPPVVELRIFEGEEGQEKDITIAFHNVNFFLFATLEARPIANGRVHTPGPPSVPVLNGCNVAGINYLERPSPAGYFIFPDLSVRHEGHYRLRFGLYEQVKDPRDADPEHPFPANPEPSNSSALPGPPQDHNQAMQRLDVLSEEFQVYSAKKFPGLDRSTGLSIGLSDQGCRVRIRRDVRMRKRPKPKPINEPQYGEDAIRGRYATPSSMPTPHDRHRSMSHGSRDGSQYGERRLSVHGDIYPNPQSNAPIAPNASMSAGGFAVPTTPSSAMPPAHYVQHHYASPVTPSSAPPGPSNRFPEYSSRPSSYQQYEHRASDASTYAPPESVSRRPSDLSVYSTSQYSYGRARPSTHVPEPSPTETRLPPVRDLLRESDAREHELREKEMAGKRSYSPPRYVPEPALKSGMRPSSQDSYDDQPPAFPTFLEYKRANGGVGHAPVKNRF